ncbi:MAG TPA: hypothetical protein VF063_10130 [Gaiellaceae bacterium]
MPRTTSRPAPFRLAALVALTAGLLLAAFAASGTALAGNAPNAKRCQKNGWQTLVTSGGTSFASEEACTSYAAQGGTLLPASQAPCLNGGWQAPAQRSDGTSFGSEADCIAYTSGNGVVYKPSLKANSPVHMEENVAIVASGFHPNSSGSLTILTLPMMSSFSLLAVTHDDGGFTGSSVFTNVACGLGTTGAQYTYVDGSGVHASASVTLLCP